MPIDGLDHVNIVTRDIEATVGFYKAVLDLQDAELPAIASESVVRWLADGTGQPILHVQQFDSRRHAPGLLASGTGPIDHVALQCRGFDGIVARCEAMNVPYRVNQLGDAFRQVFITDPNGVVLELNFRT